jgi:hypothetical protein
MSHQIHNLQMNSRIDISPTPSETTSHKLLVSLSQYIGTQCDPTPRQIITPLYMRFNCGLLFVHVINGNDYHLRVPVQCDDGRQSGVHIREQPPLPQPSALIILFSGDNYSDGGGNVDHCERRCRYGGAATMTMW